MVKKLTKRFFINEFLLSIISKITLIAISFVNSILLARILGKEILGEFTYIINIATILSIFAGLGIGESYSYFKKKYGENIRSEYINIIYFLAICYIPVLLISRYSNFFIIILISVIQQFNTQIIYIALIDNPNKKNILQIITNILYTLLLVTISNISSINIRVILMIYIAKTIFNILLIAINMKIIPNKKLINFKTIKEVFKFGIFPMFNLVLSLLNYKIDIVILKLFVDYKYIGIYSVGTVLANMLWIIPDAFKDILFKRTSKSDCIKDILFSIKLNVFFSLGIVISFAFLGKLFLKIVYGVEYIEAYLITILLLIGAIPMIYYKLINTLYISIGKQKLTFIILTFSSITNIALNFLTIPYWGIYGAGFSSLVSYSLLGIFYVLRFKKDYRLKKNNLIILSKDERKRLLKVLKNI